MSDKVQGNYDARVKAAEPHPVAAPGCVRECHHCGTGLDALNESAEMGVCVRCFRTRVVKTISAKNLDTVEFPPVIEPKPLVIVDDPIKGSPSPVKGEYGIPCHKCGCLVSAFAFKSVVVGDCSKCGRVTAHVDGMIFNFTDIKTILLQDVTTVLEEKIADLEDKLRKALAFKAYTHQRLDDAGIEKDPPSPHRERGCRIGARLDIVLAAFEEQSAKLAPRSPKPDVLPEMRDAVGYIYASLASTNERQWWLVYADGECVGGVNGRKCLLKELVKVWRKEGDGKALTLYNEERNNL